MLIVIGHFLASAHARAEVLSSPGQANSSDLVSVPHKHIYVYLEADGTTEDESP